jgi:hypothetical protein
MTISPDSSVRIGLLVGAAHQAALVEVVALLDALPELGAAFHGERALVGTQMDVGAVERESGVHEFSSASISA